MKNLKEYKYNMSKFFEECELKNVSWDTQDDNLWVATFESKSGQKRQYKSNRQTMFEFSKKVGYKGELFENKAHLVSLWRLYTMNIYTQEYNLNRLLNQLKPNENDEFCDCNCNTASSCIACRHRTKSQEAK